jgi:hypothetical protein
MIELRCSGTMHGKLAILDGKLEVKCGRRGCGAKRGVVVLHTFDLTTGDLVATNRFADPVRNEETHASR